MKIMNELALRMSLVLLLLFGCLSTVWAQTPGNETGPEGRPIGAQPGPTPIPTGQPAVVLAESDSDEPGASMTGDVGIQDQVIADDLIVDGSACVGNDCFSGVSFGFDTLRFMENNLRIHFDDTSTIQNYPRNDWRIIINDSTDGGANYFAVENSTEGVVPFKIEAGARADSIRVDDAGRVGLKTANPVLELHIADGDTPGVRLEQTNMFGWTPQTWDVAGNETSFFIRDVTNGSTLPFRIFPGAPSNSLVIGGASSSSAKHPGDVGVGVLPQASLHVRRSDGTAQVLVEEANAMAEVRVLLDIKNNGPAQALFRDAGAGAGWVLGFGAAGFTASYTSTAGVSVDAFHLKPDGNLTIARALTEMSDAAQKEDFAPMNGGEVLARLAEMPVNTWKYKGDEANVRHAGPTAQDFHAAFGLGQDDRRIAPLDTNGVALAAIQELYRQMQIQNARIEEQNIRIKLLEQQNALLQAQLTSTK